MPPVKHFFKNLFPKSEILFTNSGRSAIQAAIEDFKLENSAMILPSFICSDVFSPLLISNNIQPLLVDCQKNSWSIKLEDIKKVYYKEKKIKSLLIVHNFGMINPDIQKIALWCKKNKIILIEDCVHCLNIQFKGKQAGSFGDAAVFSFSKVSKAPIGGVYINNQGEINVKIKNYKLNNLDLYRILASNLLGRFLIDIMRIFNKNKTIKVNPEKIEILPLPLSNLFYFSNKTIDIKRRILIANKFLKILQEHIRIKVACKNNFFESIPLFVSNREVIFAKLINKAIRTERLWTNPLSLNKELKEKYPLIKTPNAEKFSKQVINVVINPNLSNTKISKDFKSLAKIAREIK